ncbi:MAG: hypothetical protein ACE148_16080 [Vicinamibacterales bacterium]
MKAAATRSAPLWFLMLLPASAMMVQAVAAPAQESKTSATGAKTWIGHYEEVERFMATAKVLEMEEVPIGVTRPKKIRLEPGGPVDYIAFKALTPGIQKGFYESYKCEIAAYLMDRLIGLDMVPPKVERRVQGNIGAAVMWVKNTKSWKELGGAPKPPPDQQARWTRQLSRAKMFDNLIGNPDPNLGNWLVDTEWNLILIDHSRAFRTENELFHKMITVDQQLWEQIKALDEARLKLALGKWLGSSELRAVLRRRDRMQQEIDKMVADRGDIIWIR